MKRLVLLIVALLLVSVISVSAEGIDLSDMTSDEISSLYESVLDEMYSRGILRSGELQEGVYYIGVDVAPGAYNISSSDEYYSRYYVFESQDIYDKFLELNKNVPLYIDANQLNAKITEDSPKIDLRDGNILIVLYGSIKLEEVRNLLMP
jgi:hypothetical protein